MKKQFLSVIVLFVASLAIMAFTIPSGKIINPPQEQVAPAFPEDVQKILETSCHDCHTDAATNVKSKSKLNFSKWTEYSDAKKVGKMESINEVIVKGDMPPGKYINNHPEKALGQEQKDIIGKWVSEASAKLMGE